MERKRERDGGKKWDCFHGFKILFFQNGGSNMRHSLRAGVGGGGGKGVLLPCRWISIIEMFEVSPGDALGVFGSCHQTKPMVTSASSMFSNRITCLGEPSGWGKKKKKNYAKIC